MPRLLALFLLVPLYARAHPHVWIDVLVQPLQDGQGRITALAQSWQFDPFYSALLLEEVARGGEGQTWQDLERDIRTTLTDEGLYTFPREQFAAVRAFRLERRGDELWVQAELPLAEPAYRLRYQIYEPEYYVEILHAAGQPLSFGNCRLEIAAAEPDEEKYLEAAALDKDAKGDPNLGRFFAQTADLYCGEEK